jgi:hypothetical protein
MVNSKSNLGQDSSTSTEEIKYNLEKLFFSAKNIFTRSVQNQCDVDLYRCGGTAHKSVRLQHSCVGSYFLI